MRENQKKEDICKKYLYFLIKETAKTAQKKSNVVQVDFYPKYEEMSVS